MDKGFLHNHKDDFTALPVAAGLKIAAVPMSVPCIHRGRLAE